MLETTVYAPEDAGISAVAGIRAELVAAIDKSVRGSTIVFDLGRTSKADSSLAQLIVSSRVAAEAKGITLAVKTTSDGLSMFSLLSCDSMDERAGATA